MWCKSSLWGASLGSGRLILPRIPWLYNKMLFAISCFTHLEYNSKQATHKRLHIVVDLDVNLVLSMMLFYFYLHKKFVSPGHINWNPHIYIHNILRMHRLNTSFINSILLWNLYCFLTHFASKICFRQVPHVFVFPRDNST